MWRSGACLCVSTAWLARLTTQWYPTSILLSTSQAIQAIWCDWITELKPFPVQAEQQKTTDVHWVRSDTNLKLSSSTTTTKKAYTYVKETRTQKVEQTSTIFYFSTSHCVFRRSLISSQTAFNKYPNDEEHAVL